MLFVTCPASLILQAFSINLADPQTKNYDVTSNYMDISEPTLFFYLNALERLYVIEDVPAWCPSIRSATGIRSGKKREFTDPSVAVAAFALSPEALLHDLNTFGAKHLLELKNLIAKANEEKKAMLREPDLLIVITGGEMSYARKDGVKVIPIGALRD